MGNGFTRLTGGSSTQTEEVYDESKFLIDQTKLRYGYEISHSENTIVYRGTYMEKSVVIKVVEKAKGTDVSPARKEKFRQEVRLLAGAKNDNIVKLIGFSMEPFMTLVTENMKGGSLQKYLWSISPHTIVHRDAYAMALQISRAMQYLHENGIIHRNLNPSNIFLAFSKRSVKLGDFGLCREGLEGDFTADVGSIRWMAPEVYSREQNETGTMKTRYNHKADVYSYAIVLWELFANKKPFQGMDNKMIAQAVLNNERPSLEDKRIPQDVHSLLQSCWSSDPQERLEFSEITAILEEIMNSIDPGWDKLPPTIFESRMEETALAKAKHFSYRLWDCIVLITHYPSRWFAARDDSDD